MFVGHIQNNNYQADYTAQHQKLHSFAKKQGFILKCARIDKNLETTSAKILLILTSVFSKSELCSQLGINWTPVGKYRKIFNSRDRQKAKISVCLSVYKTKLKYLKECIESVFSQNFTDSDNSSLKKAHRAQHYLHFLKKFCNPARGEAMKTYYIVSGGFDPIHEGHISMIKASAAASDGVILLLNSDAWLCRKKGTNFLSFNTRKIICENLKGVLEVISFNDDDNSASDGIIKARQKYPNDKLVFANGGDRTKENIPENEVCLANNVELKFGIGGGNKANASSKILKEYVKKVTK